MAWAQAIPVNAYFNPAELEEGVEAELIVEYGTQEQPANEVLYVNIEVAYEGFSIESTPTLDLSGSWMCADGNCDANIEVDHAKRIITLTIARTDGDPRSGEGLIALGKGIIAVMDELHGKKESGIVQVRADFQQLAGGRPSFSYRYEERELWIENLAPDSPNQLIVTDINGQILWQAENVSSRLTLPIGENRLLIFWLEVEGKRYYQKLNVLP